MTNEGFSQFLAVLNLVLSLVLILQFGFGVFRVAKLKQIGVQRIAQTALVILFTAFVLKGVLQVALYSTLLTGDQTNIQTLTNALLIENVKNLIVNIAFIVVGVYFAYINEN